MRTLILMAFTATGLFAANETLTGTISDSNCGASHKTAIEHSGKQVSDRQCALACIKGGAKYVFVSDNKVYTIENQTFSDLSKYAGDPVKMTGDVQGSTVTVAKLAKP